MFKGCLYIIVMFVLLVGSLYYVYEKRHDEINGFAEKTLRSFYEENISPLFDKHANAYSDSIKIFLKKKFSEIESGKEKLSEEKLREIYDMLKKLSRERIIDSVDFDKLKKAF